MELRYKLSFWTNNLLYAIALTIPLIPRYHSVFLMILLLLFIYNKEKDYNWIKISGNGLGILMILFYIYYVAGLFWTDNFNAAALDLQIKLPLLIFPLIIYFGPVADRSVRYKIYRYFIYGLEAAIYFCFARACFFYLYDGSNFFLYKDFSFFIHPGYFAMYLCFGSVIVLQRLLAMNTMVNFMVTFQWYRLFLFSFAIILLASKAGIFIQLLVLSVAFILATWYLKKRLLANILLPGMLVVAMIYFGLFSSITSGRMEELKQTINTTATKEIHSSAMRLQAWESALQVIYQHPMAGSGTGDSKTVLINKYNENGFFEILALKLNAHNQFLQTAVTIGIPGAMLLILLLISGFLQAVIRKNWLLLALIIISGLNFLIESVLEVSAGAMFFGLFYSVLGKVERY